MSRELRLLDRPADLRAACHAARAAGERVGFVPTMGSLHDGHLALCAEAQRRADRVVVSIFVNPTQFGPSEDLARYPRTLERDLARCEAQGVSLVFVPSVEAMYPAGGATRVEPGPLSEPLCGRHRPGHFAGVATVVVKLLTLVGPCVAVFGRKDYQQLRVVSEVAEELLLPVEIVGHPTVREPDGLAMSSRNAYLSPEERARARSVPEALRAAWARYAAGERDAGALARAARAVIEPRATSIDYVEVADPGSLRVAPPGERVGSRALVALAARFGETRLIDNMVLGEEEPPAALSEEEA